MQKNMLEYNRYFVKNQLHTSYFASSKPARRTAILTCMDTRLTHLLTAALGIKDGDAKIIRNAGGTLLDEYDTTIRSLLVAILEFDISYLDVIGHTDCGVSKISSASLIDKLYSRGISPSSCQEFAGQCPAFEHWFSGFSNVEEEVIQTVKLLKNHPLMPKDICIQGYLMDIDTGELSPLI
ncbi:carbonic anhydrase [Aequitasia blattaphilus]|uniref:carbonic anhydrase n=1 Tax=Aequitasia blattaphilus TaxID=2949332 RepID=A0ABT1E9K2_9FIRM|nr:carbonic anhydrase [Aequitasia blattaphilus]MCP1102371.1 carbonic anhydrase [Aequitasia blattaphilus]MCR8615011.1 carbonic anhydrase [Aequitasia blattaphilus]